MTAWSSPIVTKVTQAWYNIVRSEQMKTHPLDIGTDIFIQLPHGAHLNGVIKHSSASGIVIQGVHLGSPSDVIYFVPFTNILYVRVK